MLKETDHSRHPSSSPDSEVYDPCTVDSIDLQSLSLNYPPIKPERREGTPNSSSSSSSNTQDSLPRQINIKMFPEWFFDRGSRGRSPESQAPDEYSLPTTRCRGDDEARLPSYNELYELDNPGQSSSIHDRRDATANCYPLVGGLDFSPWEGNDPEGDACLAAVSSTSRESLEAEGDVTKDELEFEDTQDMRGDDVNEDFGGLGPLVDLGDDDTPFTYPRTHLTHPPTHRPDFPGVMSSYPSLASHRHPVGNSNPELPDPEEYEPDSNESSLSMILYKPVPANADGLSFNTTASISKRKYDDEDGQSTYDDDTNGPSIQPEWKKSRTRLPSPTPEDDRLSTQSPVNTSVRHETSNLMDAEEEWQGDSLTMDISDHGDVRSDRSSGHDDASLDELANVNHGEHEQQRSQDSAFEQSSQFDNNGHHQQDGERLLYRSERYIHEGHHLNSNLPIQEQPEHLTYRDHQSEDSHPSSAVDGEAWPSDGLTVVDPSADWLGQVPTHSSTRYDNAMEGDQNIQASDDSLDSLSESRMVVEPLSTSQPTESAELPSPPIEVQIEFRKRPAEGVNSTPGPIRKKSRKQAPKIVLAKALPKPDPKKSPVPLSPKSSPTRSKNSTLGMKPRRPWNSAPNRPSASTSASPHLNIVTNQGPEAFFASVTAPKKVMQTKQRVFKPPLAGGGITLRPRDPNQPPSNINYGTSNPGASTTSMSITARLAILEQEARTLRQAVKYQNETEEDERLQHLIDQWRTAGRDVVEQIFDRVPKPTEIDQVKSARGPWMTSGRDDGMELTEEQESWLRDCAKNEDGEPVDDEGNTLLPKTRDLSVLLEQASEGGRGEKEGYYPHNENENMGQRTTFQPEAREWNMGTMMIKMSIDPALLGWDDDLEDWADSDRV